jgi:hypothetical protein
MTNNTTGGGNTAVGAFLNLSSNTTGAGNIAFGNACLANNTTGSQNTAIGGLAVLNNIEGTNTGIGRAALQNTTSNIATLGAITGGSGYTDGFYAGVSIYGNGTNYFPYGTMDLTVAGGAVTVVTIVNSGAIRVGQPITIDPLGIPAGLATGSGFSVLVATTNFGTNNTAIGRFAGQNNLTGSRNVFIGSLAGQNEQTSDNLYISNSNTSTPLIKGKFDSSGGYGGSLTINGTLIIVGGTPPATASSTGTAGTVVADSDYIYVCIAANTWKRSAITTW